MKFLRSVSRYLSCLCGALLVLSVLQIKYGNGRADLSFLIVLPFAIGLLRARRWAIWGTAILGSAVSLIAVTFAILSSIHQVQGLEVRLGPIIMTEPSPLGVWIFAAAVVLGLGIPMCSCGLFAKSNTLNSFGAEHSRREADGCSSMTAGDCNHREGSRIPLLAKTTLWYIALLGIMVALGLAAGILMPALTHKKAPVADTKIILSDIASAMQSYRQEYGHWPGVVNTSLAAELGGKNARKLPFLALETCRRSAQGELIDAWGTPLRFRLTADGAFEIISAGPDLVFGTPDDLSYLVKPVKEK